jgi:hypothetical protein
MTRSYPPPEWRRAYAPRRTWTDRIVDALLLTFAAVVVLALLEICSGCSSLAAQRSACSVVGVALNSVAEPLTDAITDHMVATGSDDVPPELAKTVAAYEVAAAAQNAWADALEAGHEYPIDAMRAAYCDARGALVTVQQLPDWPLGGCS